MGLEHMLAAGAVAVFLLTRPASGQPPPPGQTGTTGLYLPMYSQEMSAAARLYNTPGLPNLFTANPNSGPSSPTARPDVYQNALALKQQNPQCKVLGYIATGYSATPQSEIRAEVDLWATWNSGGSKVIDGIMWDEASNQLSTLPYYTEITNYARSKGLTYIRANPGSNVPEQFVQLYDVTTINENAELISESTLKARTFNGRYPKSKFNYLAHTVPFLDENWFRMAMKYVGTIYITNEAGPPANPWDVPASYLAREVAILEGRA